MSMTSKQSGFSFIELLVSAALVSILAALAIPNYREVKGRRYEATVQSDMRNLKTALYAAAAEREGDGYFYVRTVGNTGYWYRYQANPYQFQSGTFDANGPFPDPFDSMVKSDGSQIYGAYEYTYNGNNYTYVYMTHEKSKHRFYEYQTSGTTYTYKFTI